MSKKTHQKAIEKEAEAARRAQARGSQPAIQSTGKPRREAAPGPAAPARAKTPARVNSSSAARAVSGASAYGAAPTPDRSSVLAVRVTGLVIAAAALAGAIFWVQSVQGAISGAVVIGLILLGVAVLMGLSAAIRPGEVARRARATARRRIQK